VVASSDTETGYKIPKDRKECGLPLELGSECTVERDERSDADEHTVEIVELFPPEEFSQRHVERRLNRVGAMG
jgi:hypothetical protein